MKFIFANGGEVIYPFAANVHGLRISGQQPVDIEFDTFDKLSALEMQADKGQVYLLSYVNQLRLNLAHPAPPPLLVKLLGKELADNVQ